MSRTYAIGDIHGRFDLLTLAVAEITARGGGKVVFLGDYVDRGPQSREVLEALIAGPPTGQEWVCLKGNHEDMMVETITVPLEPDWWIGNGGAATVASYGGEIPLAHVRWARGLPLSHETRYRIFCHAGGDPSLSVADQTEKSLIWFRCKRDFDYGLDGKHVVHGHTPFKDGPVCLPNRTNLDTGAYATGRLSVAVFDDGEPGGPIDVFSVTVPSPIRSEGA
ncbi:serine/threonine protein phosphatase [Methylorubrum sp. B1-46]|jgi:serine/threonine protein phosphatase 1|uniref:metallophosphoesterase family protein n=1 Tax=Methylorubrum sp. B1-46 TaxID=2897334 RepID=UPI001E4DCDDD|nr:metallophosphoesterase family protein [Methylorubrum sp. B1-46]UGB24706.1 serine/threonine protein phosphatase [Methylorubrum sp. B1-46]